MTAVTVSPKYQVVIPREVRESMGITAGQKMQVLTYRGRIELVPVKPMSESRGLLPGLDTDLERDDDRL
ncbi:MAG: AbrB/MazE/SpoVT family DNA-binding domain-containing protein [Pseudomonadota bacterium]